MLNVVNFVGRLTRDPELRKTQSGTSVASFTLAVDGLKGADGEKNTLFMDCSVFGKQSDTVVKFSRKGSLLGVSGRLETRKYVRKADNVEVTAYQTIVDRVFLMPNGNGDAQPTQSAPSAPQYQPSPEQAPQQEPKPSGSNLNTIDVEDDDLPF